jgi:hypothetical protein
MCYGEIITIEVRAINSGLADPHNTTAVLELVQAGRASAEVIAVEHMSGGIGPTGWEILAGLFAPPQIFGTICILALATLATMGIYHLLERRKPPEEKRP